MEIPGFVKNPIFLGGAGLLALIFFLRPSGNADDAGPTSYTVLANQFAAESLRANTATTIALSSDTTKRDIAVTTQALRSADILAQSSASLMRGLIEGSNGVFMTMIENQTKSQINRDTNAFRLRAIQVQDEGLTTRRLAEIMGSLKAKAIDAQAMTTAATLRAITDMHSADARVEISDNQMIGQIAGGGLNLAGRLASRFV